MRNRPAPARHAGTSPYRSSTTTKPAAQRNPIVMSKAKAAMAASEVCRTALPAEALKSSIMRRNIDLPLALRRWPDQRRHYLCQKLPAPITCTKSPAPSHADEEAQPKRKANGRQRPLRDDVLQRFLDR